MSIRTQETRTLHDFLSGEGGALLTVTGRKKVGKTGFVLGGLKDEKRQVTYYECRDTCESSNFMFLSKKMAKDRSFQGYEELFSYVTGQDERVIVFDEFQRLWKIAGKKAMDWLLMLSTKHKVIVITSSELLAKEIGTGEKIEIADPDYREAAEMFYPNLDARTKLAFFAVFGSSLLASGMVDPSISVKKNIKNLILEPAGALRLYIEHEELEDLGKTGYGHTILSSLSDRRMRYSEIEALAGQTNNGLLDKQMKILADMGAIRRTLPINRMYDRKKALYETEDNLIRFYYTFVYPHKEELTLLGSKEFYTKFVQPGLEKYIESRCQEALLQYFRSSDRPGVREAGRYLTDTAEWPVVLRSESGTRFYDICTGKQKLSQKEVDERLSSVPEKNSEKGIFSLNGFECPSDGRILISAKDLYA